MHPLLGGEKEKMCLTEKVIEALGQQKLEKKPIKSENLIEKIAEEISVIVELATEKNKKIMIKTPDNKWISISPASIKVGKGAMARFQIMRIPPHSNLHLKESLIEKLKKEPYLCGIVKIFFLKPEITILPIIS